MSEKGEMDDGKDVDAEAEGTAGATGAAGVALAARTAQQFGPFTLCGLPREMLVYVLAYVDTADVPVLRRTSRLLRDAMDAPLLRSLDYAHLVTCITPAVDMLKSVTDAALKSNVGASADVADSTVACAEMGSAAAVSDATCTNDPVMYMSPDSNPRSSKPARATRERLKLLVETARSSSDVASDAAHRLRCVCHGQRGVVRTDGPSTWRRV